MVNRHMRSCIALLLIAVVVSSSACARSFRHVDSKFSAVDHGAPVAWIDNDRVMFVGFDHMNLGPMPKGGYDWGRAFAKTYIWNVKTNQITKYRDFRVGQLCYAEGYISYLHLIEPDVRMLYRGQFGAETAMPEPKYVAKNRFDCIHEFSEPMAWRWGTENNRTAQPLRKIDGFLDLGPANKRREDTEEFRYRLMALDGTFKAYVDVDRRRNIRATNYLPFRDQYLLIEHRRDMSTPFAWYMSRDGSVSRVPVPFNGLTGVTLFPMRAGLLLIAIVSKTPTDPGDAGLYWVSSGAMKRVLTGIIERVGVSPDGCRIAFSFAPTSDELTQGRGRMRRGLPGNTMQMIDTCAE